MDRKTRANQFVELAISVGRSMITEIKCKCGHKNPAKDRYQVGITKDICEKCGEELPLEAIYGQPSKEFFDCISNDKEVVEKEKEKVDDGRTPIVMEDTGEIIGYLGPEKDMFTFEELIEQWKKLGETDDSGGPSRE